MALLHFLFQWAVSKKHYEDERSRATKRRWTRYFLTLVTARDSVPEVKLLDLGPVLTERYRRFMSEFRDRNRDRHLRSFVGGAVFAVLTVVAVYYMFDKVVTRVLLGELSVGELSIPYLMPEGASMDVVYRFVRGGEAETDTDLDEVLIKHIADEFKRIVDEYVRTRYGPLR